MTSSQYDLSHPKAPPILTIIHPCYNEEEILPFSISTISSYLNGLIEKKVISDKSSILFVDDGSKDRTWNILSEATSKNSSLRAIRFSTNFGHQNAIMAGIISAKSFSDCVITMDVDLQDDINAVEEMVNKYREGNEIVYGVRSKRTTDSFFKKITAETFYNLLSFMKVKTIYNHADFRLMSKPVIEELMNFKEVNLYLRGVFPLMGFQSDVVYYERKERTAGETKFPFSKMLAFAWDGVTSFSIFPLRLILFIGFFIFIVSIVLSVWAMIPVLAGKAVPGWASIVIPLFIFGGMQMICIGIIGEYVGKIYKEVKSRPRFIINKKINFPENV